MKIIIEGRPAEGKTTVALIIAEALLRHGYGLNVEDGDLPLGLNSAAACDEAGHQHRCWALAAKGLNVEIVTVQAQRPGAGQGELTMPVHAPDCGTVRGLKDGYTQGCPKCEYVRGLAQLGT
jgi:hypothetical protein